MRPCSRQITFPHKQLRKVRVAVRQSPPECDVVRLCFYQFRGRVECGPELHARAGEVAEFQQDLPEPPSSGRDLILNGQVGRAGAEESFVQSKGSSRRFY